MTDAERASLRAVGEVILSESGDVRASQAWDRVNEEVGDLACQVSHWQDSAKAWEQVARNLAQVLEGRDGDGVLKMSEQCRVHGLKGDA
jgi:hypothetical protein